jgi:hypothetical protein
VWQTCGRLNSWTSFPTIPPQIDEIDVHILKMNSGQEFRKSLQDLISYSAKTSLLQVAIQSVYPPFILYRRRCPWNGILRRSSTSMLKTGHGSSGERSFRINLWIVRDVNNFVQNYSTKPRCIKTSCFGLSYFQSTPPLFPRLFFINNACFNPPSSFCPAPRCVWAAQ